MHLQRRNSNRLKDFDYSLPGAYFVTLVTQERKPLFGKVNNEDVILNEIGNLAKAEWIKTTEMRKEVRRDQFILMPNHLHAIIFIDYFGVNQPEYSTGEIRAHGRAPLRRRPRTLGSLVAAYKAATTRMIRGLFKDIELKVWQRNYYDHIIRDQIDLDNIREYITYNPLKLSSGEFLK